MGLLSFVKSRHNWYVLQDLSFRHRKKILVPRIHQPSSTHQLFLVFARKIYQNHHHQNCFVAIVKVIICPSIFILVSQYYQCFIHFFFDTWYYFCFRIKLIRCTMKMANCFARYWKNVIVSTAAVQSHENCFRMTKLNLTNVSPIIFDLNEHFLWAYLIKGKSFLLSFVFGFVFKLK